MSTLKEAYERAVSIYACVGNLNPKEVDRERMLAFRAGAKWVIDQLDAAGTRDDSDIDDLFAELNRLRDEVRSDK